MYVSESFSLLPIKELGKAPSSLVLAVILEQMYKAIAFECRLLQVQYIDKRNFNDRNIIKTMLSEK